MKMGTLVLSRYEKQSIIINDNIKVKIIHNQKNGSVKLSVTAPTDTLIDREELYVGNDFTHTKLTPRND